MSKKWLRRLALFIAMLAVMFAMTAIRSENARDRVNAKINLTKGKTATCTVDLGQQGVVKKLLNPNMYTLYLHLQTDSKEPMLCSGSDMEMFLSQGTKKGIWTELLPSDALKSRSGRIPLNVELRVPREALKNHDVAQGVLKFYSGQEEYARVIIKVINSEIQ